MSVMQRYNIGSIERALEVHETKGLIRSWLNTRPERGYKLIVGLTGGDTLELKSLREAHVFCAGLATAAKAQDRQQERLTAGQCEGCGQPTLHAEGCKHREEALT